MTSQAAPEKWSYARPLVLVGFTLLAWAIIANRTSSEDVLVVTTPFLLGIALNLLPLFIRAKADPFEPAALTGIYAAMGLLASFSSILQLGYVDIGPMTSLSPRAKTDLAEVVVWSYPIASASYLAGYYWPGGVRWRRLFPRVDGIAWDRGRLIAACVAILLVSLPVAVFFQARLGTSFTDLTAQAQGKAVWRDDPTQTWIMRGIMLSFLPVMLLLAYSAKRLRGMRLVGMLALFGVIGLFSLRTGQRGIFGMLVMECAIIIHYLRRRIPVQLLVGVMFLGLVAFNILGEYRSSADTTSVSRVSASERFNPSAALADHERDRQRLRALAITFHYFPERQDYLYGATWLGLIATPIPRWLWADKGKYFEWRDNAIVKTLVGESTPIPYHGALYANFSWLGIVLGMAVWGMFQRGLYGWLLENPNDRSTVLLYATLLLVPSPTMMALQTNVMQFVIPVYLVLLFVGFKPRALREAAA